MKAKIEMLAVATGLALATASAAEWEGSFKNGLKGWEVLNHCNIAALSVEEFKGETAFVVRHSGTNATVGTAWELRGGRFAVKPGERFTVIVRACGSVEGMIAPHGYKGKYKTAIRWYGKDGVRIKDDSGYGLEDDTGFGISVSASRWQYSFASIDVPSKAAFAEASLGADRPDFGRDDFLAVSVFKIVPTVASGGSVTNSSLRDDGVLLVDGEPFFPIGIYGVRKCKFNGFSLEKAFADLKDAGFNLALNSTDFSVLEEFLALADRTGMKTFIMPGGNSYGVDIYAKGFLQSHRSHPSVIAWYVADDTASYASPGEVADRSRVCRTLDPDRLTLQADGALMERINRYAPYVHTTDIFLPEIYPYGFTPEPKGDEIAKFVAQMRAVDAALKENGSPVKGIWPIVQFFKGWSSSKYFPNERELRAQCFAALAHKARGLMLYLYGARSETKNEGAVSTLERWSATRRVFREVASIQADLLLRDAAEQPAVTVIEGPAVDALGQPSVSLLLKTGENPLLIAANSANERIKVRFAVKGFTCAEEVFERRRIAVAGDVLEDDFKPIGVHVYRLTKTEKGEKQ